MNGRTRDEKVEAGEKREESGMDTGGLGVERKTEKEQRENG